MVTLSHFLRVTASRANATVPGQKSPPIMASQFAINIQATVAVDPMSRGIIVTSATMGSLISWAELGVKVVTVTQPEVWITLVIWSADSAIVNQE